MKSTAILTAIAAILLAACRYQAPLVAEHTIPIDPAVIGLWEPTVGEKGKEPDANHRMLILKFSNTEYLIRQPIGDGVIHYRGYLIKPGGKTCVQLEAIGDGKGPLGGDGDIVTPFEVVSYEVKDGNLEIRTLNSELLGKGLKTTEALQEAFLKNKDHPELFGDPTVYRKVRAE